MSLISSKILSGVAVTLGDPMSAYTAMQSAVIAASGNSVVPEGDWWVLENSHVSVEVSTDGGTTWVTLYPVSVGGFIRSDGVNIRFLGDSTGGTVQYFGPA